MIIKRSWSLYDILDALESIDLEVEAEAIAKDEADKRSKRR